jgi:flagellar basal body-associated protein FliL
MADQVPPTNPVVTTNPSVGLPPETNPSTPQASEGSSKSRMWVIVAAFIVVAVLVATGIYMYVRLRETNPSFQQISQNVQESLDSAANDLTGVKADEDLSKDFSDVDKDLNNL